MNGIPSCRDYRPARGSALPPQGLSLSNHTDLAENYSSFAMLEAVRKAGAWPPPTSVGYHIPCSCRYGWAVFVICSVMLSVGLSATVVTSFNDQFLFRLLLFAII